MAYITERIKRLSRLRFAALYPMGLYLAFFTVPDDHYAPAGMAIMMAGMAVRVWSNGYAIKLDRLTTSGPYAFVRNPLYLGTALIILGVIVLLGVFMLGALFFAVMAAVYTRTIRGEQRILTEKFGAAYQDYLVKVPAMWPSWRSYKEGEKWPFCWQRVWLSREHKVFIWAAVIVIGFYIKKTCLSEGFTAKAAALAALAAGFGFLDLLGEFIRSRLKKVQACGDKAV